MLIVVKASQSENAEDSITDTPVGIVIVVKASQFANALLRIAVKESGNVISFRLVQSWKVADGKLSQTAGKVADSNKVQPEKFLSPLNLHYLELLYSPY